MRARNIKPGLFKNELLGSADPLLTILFQGLWCMADREGRLEDRPLRICAEVFPYRRSVTEKKTDAMLSWLAAQHFICRYAADGKRFIQVVAFLDHQNPHKNEAESRIPAPPSSDQALNPDSHRTSTGSAPCDDGPRPEAAQEMHRTTRADSLIPDSLIPDSSPPERGALAKGEDRKGSAPEFDPESVPGLHVPTWQRWVEYRRQIRKPLKPASHAAAAKALAAFGPDQPAVVEQSVAHGWQGLFALKTSNGAAHAPVSRFDRTAAHLDRLVAEAEREEREVLAGDGERVRPALGG